MERSKMLRASADAVAFVSRRRRRSPPEPSLSRASPSSSPENQWSSPSSQFRISPSSTLSLSAVLLQTSEHHCSLQLRSYPPRYYVAPSGKRLRSMVEVQKYLVDHPEFTRDGVTLSQFSFQIPRPLHDNYVRKRPARPPAPCDASGVIDPGEARPLAWAGPNDLTELHLRTPGLPSLFSETSDLDPVPPPAKKRSRKALNKQMYSGRAVNDQHDSGGEDRSQCRNSKYEI